MEWMGSHEIHEQTLRLIRNPVRTPGYPRHRRSQGHRRSWATVSDKPPCRFAAKRLTLLGLAAFLVIGTTTAGVASATSFHHGRNWATTTKRKPAPSITTTTPKATTTTVPATTTTVPATTPTVPATTTTPTVSSGGGVWQPAQDSDWMWEISSPLDVTNASLMGTGVTAYNGDTAPGDNATVYDIDGIINPASTVASLHAMGDRAICYIEVGAAGNYYSAAQEGISTTYYAQLQAAGDLGSELSGYPENFLNINSASTVSIIESMIQQQCAQKGFDGVETDLDGTFNNNEGSTGFTITQANEEAYLTTLANYMHAQNLAWIIKNADDTGIQSFVTDMEPLAQADLSEQCNEYSTCNLLSVFSAAGKAIFNAEYNLKASQFCPADNAAHINGVLFNVNLNGGRTPCR